MLFWDQIILQRTYLPNKTSAKYLCNKVIFQRRDGKTNDNTNRNQDEVQHIKAYEISRYILESK